MGTDGGIADGGKYKCTNDPGTDVEAGAASLALTTLPPPCTLVISPDPASVNSAQTVGFSAASSGTCATSNLVFSDDCADGDVDPVTGLFTAATTYTGESCTVSVTDTGNPDACTAPGADCDAALTIAPEVTCFLEIYVGGYPVPPLNTYNMPGRRGLALTCGATVQFDACSDCDGDVLGQNDPCQEWSVSVVSGSAPAGTSISATGLLAIGPDCTGLSAPAVLEVCVTDPCNPGAGTDCVNVTVGEVILSIEDTYTTPDAQGVNVTLSMQNLDHAVKAVQTDIEDIGGFLTCTSCLPDPDRAPEYQCFAAEQADGQCRILLLSTNPSGMIEQGSGAIATIQYDVAADAPSADCIEIAPTDSIVKDQYSADLCVCEESGELCFIVCGDVYPRDCLPDMPNCGDGIVDIFDILEEIDIVLGLVIPSDCQETRADVPTGVPPYCAAPDGEYTLNDVLTIIDMALGKLNCCDYYYLGLIY
jgi:hypothetical protein